MFDFIVLIITLCSCLIIVIVLSKMSKKTFEKEQYHYRCTNNFRHIFSVYEINTYFDSDKTINCPLQNCGGELILYELLSEDEIVRDE